MSKRKTTTKKRAVGAPTDDTPKRAHEAAPGEPVLGSGGRLVSKFKTEYGKNNSDTCAVKGCTEPMRDFKGRRTGAKGLCRMHYTSWLHQRDLALETGKQPPPPPAG